MQLFGEYDHAMLVSQGLLHGGNCEDANKIKFFADSDQRTRETAKALASGFLPHCNMSIRALPEGTPDELFHPLSKGIGPRNVNLATAAIAGRIGNNPAALADAYRTQLNALDDVLAHCGDPTTKQQARTSLFEIQATLVPGKSDHSADLKGPLNTASTLSEILLLEYTEGMPTTDVGWGCVDGIKLRSFMDLHTAASDITQRTSTVARMQASNLLEHIQKSLEQAVSQQTTLDALTGPSDRVLFLVGHDTNISNVAGLLNLNWMADGRRDDTPPGGALVFELWENAKTNKYSVRVYFTVQTLEQMRSSTHLTLDNPPQRVPVFIPGCSGEDLSCSWAAFATTMQQAIDMQYVKSLQGLASGNPASSAKTP
jgi:4-phytase / acid phosphatase